MEVSREDEIVYTTDDGTPIEGVGTPSYVDLSLDDDDWEPPPYVMSDRDKSLLAALGEVNAELFEIAKARVPDIMRSHGEDPGVKQLLALRVTQAVYGLERKAERLKES